MTLYEISKQFHLSYSHQLDGLPADHQCARLHGHNAVVEIVCGHDDLDLVGFVVDYGDLEPVREWLDKTFDHRHINDVVDFNPTAELLAEFTFDFCRAMSFAVIRVGWSETPRTWAWYRGGEVNGR